MIQPTDNAPGPSAGREQSFHFEWGGYANLTVSEIWPDGDAPENPTVDDVLARVRASSPSLCSVLRDWGFELESGLSVNGRDSGLS